MRFNGRGYTDDLLLTSLVGQDGTSGGFVKDADRATAAQARAQTSTTAVLTPSNLADRASFWAHKNGTAQTSIANNTETKITFGTESWDVGDLFASSRWTPPAGKVAMHCVARVLANIKVDVLAYLALYKNGSAYKYGPLTYPSIANTGWLFGDWADDANGTDYYEVWGYAGSDSTWTIDGTIGFTYFWGHQI